MLPTSLTLKSALWPTVFALFYIFCKITAKPTGFGSHAIHGQQCVALVKIVQRGLKRTSLRAEGRHARVARPPRLGDLSTGAQSLAAATPLVAYSPSNDFCAALLSKNLTLSSVRVVGGNPEMAT